MISYSNSHSPFFPLLDLLFQLSQLHKATLIQPLILIKEKYDLQESENANPHIKYEHIFIILFSSCFVYYYNVDIDFHEFSSTFLFHPKK